MARKRRKSALPARRQKATPATRSRSGMPQRRRRRRSIGLSASGKNITALLKMFGTALAGGIVGGIVVRRIPNLVANPMTNTAVKAAIGVGATYLIVNSVKSPIMAAGFAAGYGSAIVQELNIPGLSDLENADFVDSNTLSETLVLDDNGEIIPMGELMEEEFADFELLDNEEISDLEELEEFEEDDDLGRRGSRVGKFLRRTPQAAAVKYIYPRAF